MSATETEKPSPPASQQCAPKPEAPTQTSHVVHAKEAPARAESTASGEGKKDGNGLLLVVGLLILGAAVYFGVKFYKERKDKNERAE